MLYDGALYCGPEPDGTRYYSAALGSAPAGDFCMVTIVRFNGLYVGGDPALSSATNPGCTFAQNFAAGGTGSSGNDCYLAAYPLNGGTTASRGHLRARLSNGGTNVLASGSLLEGTTVFANGDTAVVVLQSSGGTVSLKSCLAGSSTVVTEASGPRNASFTTPSLGTWSFPGNSFAGSVQTFLFASQALADADIVNLAAGTDPETIITAGNRIKGWQFDATTPTIPAAWGATALTRTGTWTQQPVASPPIPNAATRLAVTNAPVPYGAVSVNDDGTAPTWTITGTYTGYTPTALQGRIEDINGGDVVPWTDLGSFTASAGTWSGTITVPVGGLYRLQVRDKTTTSILWRGGAPWSCCPVQGSMGQSPYVYLETTYKGLGVNTLTPDNCYYVLTGCNQVIKASSSNIGPGLIAQFNQWSAATGGVPIVATVTAVVATSSTQWANRDAAVWPQFLAALDYLKPRRVLLSWLNGAADNNLSAATIKANHDTILANLDADLTTTRSIGYRYRILPHNRDTGNTTGDRTVRVAQYEWAVNHAQAGTKVLLGPWWADMRTNAEVTGTAQAGSTNTITLAAAEPALGLAAGMAVTITGGTGAGQATTVSAVNQSTKVVTVSTTWTTIPDATSTYRIVGTSPHPDITGVLNFGPRLGQATAYCFGYTKIGGRGPVPTAATYPASGTGADGSVLTVAFTHRHGGALRTPNGGTTATGLAAFQVSEDGFTTTKTITSAVISGPNTVKLTLSAPPADKTKLAVRYGAPEPVAPQQFDAVGGGLGDLLYDDTRVPPTGGLPAYMTLSADLPATQATTPTPPAGTTQSVKSLLLVNGIGLHVVAPIKPGPANTGVRGTYTGLTASGPVTVTTDGTVLDGLDITGALTIAADNVTVRNCRIRAVQNSNTFYTITWANVAGRPPVGLTLTDCEIDGNGVAGTDAGPYPSGWAHAAAIQMGIGYTMVRCDVHGQTDGLKPQDNPAGTSITVLNSWVHGLVTFYSAAGTVTHGDCMQVAGTGAHDLTVRQCTLDGYAPTATDINAKYSSSSLMQWGAFPGNAGVLSNILLDGNWINGGGYATRLDFPSAATLTGLTISNNRFGLNHRFGIFSTGAAALNGGTATLSGNVFDVSGTTDYGTTVTAGQATP